MFSLSIYSNFRQRFETVTRIFSVKKKQGQSTRASQIGRAHV